jgi:dTMP kinase
MPPHPGRLFTFEGIDGSGKTTQLELLARRLKQAGRVVVCAQEPGGTRAGREIRRLLLDAGSSDLRPMTELLLYFASRAQNIEEVIRPALADGRIVLCDRFTDASAAYQGYARGLGMDTVLALERIACGGLKPDLTFLLDVEPETGLRRQSRQTRFEREGVEFQRRVREGYLEIHRREPGRVLLIDGGRPAEEIARDIWSRVQAYV